MITISGSCASTASSASSPVSASLTSSQVVELFEQQREPWRTVGWSSTARQRVATLTQWTLGKGQGAGNLLKMARMFGSIVVGTDGSRPRRRR